MKRLKFITTFVISVASIFILSGCGKEDTSINSYKENMTQFFDNMKVLDEAINSLDPSNPNTPTQLLSYLDSMQTSFHQMAALDVPKQFVGIKEISEDACKYMDEAVSCYHKAYEGDYYDANMADIAYQNYVIANGRIQYIVQILHGDIPEELFKQSEDSSEPSNQTIADESPTSKEDNSASSEDEFDYDEEDTIYYFDVTEDE